MYHITLLLLAVLQVRADSDVNPDPIPGWTTSGLAGTIGSGSPIGVVLSGGDVQFSSPVVADIDGDPSNGLEAAVESADGTINVVKANGQPLWSASLPNRRCTAARNNNRAYSSPAVGILYGDGVPYVIAGYGGLGARACDGGVIAYRGSDGAEKWRFSTKKFARKAKFGASMHGVFGSPAVADVDGDGKLEVGFGSFS